MILLDTNVVVAFLNGEGPPGFESQRLEFLTGFYPNGTASLD
jgi:predicted nucleic acid-binding protein